MNLVFHIRIVENELYPLTKNIFEKDKKDYGLHMSFPKKSIYNFVIKVLKNRHKVLLTKILKLKVQSF